MCSARHACVPQNVRVVQPNLVYAVGLPMEICHEDVLKDTEYFGQFGKTVKVRRLRLLLLPLLSWRVLLLVVSAERVWCSNMLAVAAAVAVVVL